MGQAKGRAVGRSVGYWLRAFLLIGLCAVWLYPTTVMIGNSFSAYKTLTREPPSVFPRKYSAQNYEELLSLKLLPRWVANTLMIAAVHVIGGVLINGAAGYVFAFHKARWAKVLFWVMMLPIFVSTYVLLVPQFVVFGKLGMIGMPAVILPALWPTGVYLFRSYFKTIPASFLESARLDGAGEWVIFSRIVIPVSAPIIASAAVLLAMASIGAYIWPMLNLRDPETQTYLVGMMASAINVYAIRNAGKDLAIGVMCMVPYFLIFAVANRYFIGGLTGGAVKE